MYLCGVEDPLKVSLIADPLEVSVRQHISEKLVWHSHQQGRFTGQLLFWFDKGWLFGQTVSCLPVPGPGISLWGCHTNYHRVGGLPNRNLLSLEVWDQVVNRAIVSSKICRGEPFLASSWFLAVPFSPWFSLTYSCVTSITTSVVAWHSAAVSSGFTWPCFLCVPNFSCLIKTSIIGLGQPNPIWLLNLIKSSKTLLPNKATFIGRGDEYFNIPFRDTFFSFLEI